MKQEIIDGNRLIAEFMGASHVVDGDLMYNKESQFYCGLYACPVNQLLYHSSWDWQIPVWSKLVPLIKIIASEKNDDSFDKYTRILNCYESAVASNDPKTGKEIIVKAITWYNT